MEFTAPSPKEMEDAVERNKGRQETAVVGINRTRAIKEFVAVERLFYDGEVFERNRIGLAEADEDHVAAGMMRDVHKYAADVATSAAEMNACLSGMSSS